MARYLITAALPYSNGRLHVGHIAGAYLPADIYVRYLRSRGDEVRFICGSDDNGVAIEIAAAKEGCMPAELSARYNARQAADFAGLGIEFDIYGGTHQPGFVELHERFSQDFFRRIYANGHFVKRTTSQLYDVKAGRFLPDRYVRGTCHHPGCGQPAAYGDQCEACGQNIDPLKLVDPVSVITGTRPEVRQTTHWFLQLGKFQGMLADWFSLVSLDWRPIVTNFALARIKDGLPERPMTRDLAWGVPVPLKDPEAAGKVLYVWFDAPIGYVSFTAALCAQRDGDAEAYRRWWCDPECRILHFIGEDNIVFHALIWPAMLLGTHYNAEEIVRLGSRYAPPKETGHFQLPSNVVANAFLNIKFPGREEEKISKSRGTAVWIEDYLRSLDPDPLRYYLTAIAPESQRTTWDFEAFVERNNGELIATLGNFVNRWQKIVTEDFGRRVPAAAPDEADRGQLAEVRALVETVGADLDGHSFRSALGGIMDGFRACNRYIDAQAPWKTRKSDAARCAAAIFTCIQCTRTLGVLLTPFLPFAGEKIRHSLGLEPGEWRWPRAADEMPAGRSLGPAPEVLFKRIELADFAASGG